ncbi:MAG: M28 family peptidase [Planctomycetes bacterium]|nr:M28 family peptidase [Planctomycetota bacterium]
MRTSTALSLCGIGLVACIGAAMAGKHLATAAPQRPPQQPTIDRSKVPQLEPVRAPADLGAEAFEHVRALTGFGPRTPGSPGWTQQLDYVQRHLEGLGLTVQRDTWTDRKELVTFTNLAARIPGDRDERIVLGCHHDTKCTRGHPDPAHNFHFVGANDGASGVALLLALAPVLQRARHRATIELVFFDGEESLDWAWNDAARALFGSRRFVKRHRDAQLLGEEPRIAALILLDMVGRTDLHIQEELYSTRRLRELTWAAAVACGHQQHFFQRAEAASDDHVPFLEVGIPSVDLIDLNGNPHWHKPTDTIENMAPASLQKVADVVLTMLPEVERLYVLGDG